MKYIITSESIVLFVSGKPVKISKSAPVYAKIIKAFRLPEEQQEDAILMALSERNVNKNIEKEGFIVQGDNVFYLGEKLPAPLAQKIVSMMKENLPVELFKAFWSNLKLNPSSASVTQLYDFLAYKELPLTEDGCFLAYKGVEKSFWSKMGNLETVVIKGKVNAKGQIYNAVGEEIEIRRNSVDDNREHTCSFGVHVGSLDYATGWGPQVVVVKVNPKDVVSVPTDHSCQKLRCCGYNVLQTLDAEITAPVVDKENKPVVNPSFKKEAAEKSSIEDRVAKYLEKCALEPEEWSAVSVKRVRNIFSPKYPSKTEVICAAQAVGYRWGLDTEGREVIFLD